MSRDLLAEATRALREAHENPVDGARFTRSRLMASLDQARVRRRTRLAFVIPIAACFVTLSAWGAANGKLPALVKAAASVLGFESAPPVRPDPTARPRAAVARPAPPPRETAPAEIAPPLAAAPAEEAAPPAVPIAPAPERRRAPALAPSATDPTHDLYRVAHRAHFVDQNPAAALAAWDAYLGAALGETP